MYLKTVEPQFEQPKRRKRPQKLIQKWQPRGQPVKVTESLPTVVPKDAIVNNGTTTEGTTSGNYNLISLSSNGSPLKVQHEDKGKGAELDTYSMEEFPRLGVTPIRNFFDVLQLGENNTTTTSPIRIGGTLITQ